MLVLALAFVPIAVAPLLADLGEATTDALTFATWLIWAAFVVEYVVLLYLAPDRWKMVRTHVLDLLIIVLPFLRPLRALRVLRALSGLGRASVALRKITSRHGFRGFLAVAIGLVVAGGLVTYSFERGMPGSNITTPADALWWAVVTSTTVGYGDHFPVSNEGRGVAVVLMLVGIGLLSVVTANVAAYFVESENDETTQRLERIEHLLAEIAGRAPDDPPR